MASEHMGKEKSHKEIREHHKEMVKHHKRELQHHEKEMTKHMDEKQDKVLIKKMIEKDRNSCKAMKK